MSPNKQKTDKRELGKLILLTIWLTLLTFFLTLVLFIAGIVGYLKDEFIDYKLHTLGDGEAWLLPLLLGLPICMLVVCMIVLFYRALRDDDSSRFYSFCLFMMSLTPFSYCALWCIYVFKFFDDQPASLSLIAFALVVLLIIPVIYMTYLTMWTPERPPLTVEVSGVRESQWWEPLRRIYTKSRDNLTGVQEGLKTGVTKSPFWAIVYFFTIFLGVTYLFGFAFAFHDKANLESKQRPALFATRSALYNVGQYPAGSEKTGAATTDQQPKNIDQAQANSNAPDNSVTPNWPEYVFYFNTYSGNPEYPDSTQEIRIEDSIIRRRAHEQAERELNSSALNDQQRKERRKKVLSKVELKTIDDGIASLRSKWREWKNSQHLDRLVEAIIHEDDAAHGQGLLIQLRGSADEKRVNAPGREGVNYPDNYTLSEARAQAIKYALLERLAKRGRLQSNFQWVILALSNEDLLIPMSPEERQVEQQRGNPRANDEVSMLQNQIKGISNDPAVDKYLSTSLTTYINRIEKLKDDRKVDDDGVYNLTNKLKSYMHLMLEAGKATEAQRRALEEQRKALAEIRKQAKEDLQESLDIADYDLVDRDAGKRAVVVTIKPAQQSPSHLFAPLSLMDYMYFTIYTITTTGYGDIVPSTTYAKFLCSSANILEVFFFVVFFNGLLSMKRSLESPLEREGSSAQSDTERDARAQTVGGNGEMNSTDIEKLVEENQKTLKDVQALLAEISNRRWWRFW